KGSTYTGVTSFGLIRGARHRCRRYRKRRKRRRLPGPSGPCCGRGWFCRYSATPGCKSRESGWTRCGCSPPLSPHFRFGRLKESDQKLGWSRKSGSLTLFSCRCEVREASPMDTLPPTLFWLTLCPLCSVLPKLTEPLLNTLEILTLKMLFTVGMFPASIPFIIWSGRMNRHSPPAHILV